MTTVAYELLVGNCVITGDEQYAERAYEHAQCKENNGHKIASLHTNTPVLRIG